MSTIKIAARFRDVISENNIALYRFLYVYSEPVPIEHGVVTEGGLSLDLAGMTETEANAFIQQSIADDANAQTSNSQSFTIDDVRGGRI